MPYLFNDVKRGSISGYIFRLSKINMKWWASPIKYCIRNLLKIIISAALCLNNVFCPIENVDSFPCTVILLWRSKIQLKDGRK